MEWDPTQFFRPAGANTPYAILVLNQPINQSAWDILRKHACFTICADGGANQFYSLMKKRGTESGELPDAIVGDLDSITPEIRAHYEKLNVEVVEETEQYSTDFTKCLRHLRSNKEKIISAASSSSSSSSAAASSNDLDVIVLGGLGGRVDQAFAQIHHLYACSNLSPADAGRPEGDMYIVSEENISFVLRQGHNTILTPGGSKLYPNNRAAKAKNASDAECFLSENIGIVPVGGSAVISTTGLEWDVRDWKTEFGGQISTSNHIREDVVVVETSVPVLFTVELSQSLKCSGRR